jgi:hypothetical protein
MLDEIRGARHGGHQHQMNMVGHQAIGPNRNTCGAAALREQRPIFGIVAIGEKRLLPPTAPLRDVMRAPRYHDTRQSSHWRTASWRSVDRN